MPELPEVETVRRSLERVMIGKKIASIHVREKRLRVTVQPWKLRRWLAAQRFVGVHRRAKYVLCEMENHAHLLIHLGMSGRLLWCPGARPLEKHDHIRFVLEDGDELRFHDPRRFGLVDAIPPGELEEYAHLRRLGVEPLSDEFSAELLFRQTRRLARPVKNYLMDGNKIVGVGNIYANEALFRAGIHPQKAVGKLRLAQWQKLVEAVRAVLEIAIASGGTTLNDFYDSNGEMGYFQQHLKVYGRERERCDVCGATIRRIVQLGRSSYYCPKCQGKSR
jgi:formamidopyrimidine-DNA glycosylase